MRDTQLDIYRALLMLYIICVIHVLYWLEDGREPFLSLLLVEMPLIFFVSGAAVSVSRSRQGIWDTIVNRLKRVAAPYYIYAALLVIVGGIVSLACYSAGVHHGALVDITKYGWRDIAAILAGRNIPQFPFIWHLWFIPPYLILSCTFPLQVKLMKKVSGAAYFAACIILFLVCQAVTSVELIRQVLCFNIFMVAGYLFYRKIKVTRIALSGAVLLAILLGAVFIFGIDFFPMQGHKFPPDWLYVAYNLLVLCLLSLIASRLQFKNYKVLKLWNERGYHIYLYQSVVFTIVDALRHETIFGMATSPLLRTLLDASVVFLLCTGLSYVTYPIEKFVMKKMNL